MIFLILTLFSLKFLSSTSTFAISTYINAFTQLHAGIIAFPSFHGLQRPVNHSSSQSSSTPYTTVSQPQHTVKIPKTSLGTYNISFIQPVDVSPLSGEIMSKFRALQVIYKSCKITLFLLSLKWQIFPTETCILIFPYQIFLLLPKSHWFRNFLYNCSCKLQL